MSRRVCADVDKTGRGQNSEPVSDYDLVYYGDYDLIFLRRDVVLLIRQYAAKHGIAASPSSPPTRNVPAITEAGFLSHANDLEARWFILTTGTTFLEPVMRFFGTENGHGSWWPQDISSRSKIHHTRSLFSSVLRTKCSMSVTVCETIM